MSEWLGTGLQNRLHQFESGWNLDKGVHNLNSFFISLILLLRLICIELQNPFYFVRCKFPCHYLKY